MAVPLGPSQTVAASASDKLDAAVQQPRAFPIQPTSLNSLLCLQESSLDCGIVANSHSCHVEKQEEVRAAKKPVLTRERTKSRIGALQTVAVREPVKAATAAASKRAHVQ